MTAKEYYEICFQDQLKLNKFNKITKKEIHTPEDVIEFAESYQKRMFNTKQVFEYYRHLVENIYFIERLDNYERTLIFKYAIKERQKALLDIKNIIKLNPDLKYPKLTKNYTKVDHWKKHHHRSYRESDMIVNLIKLYQ